MPYFYLERTIMFKKFDSMSVEKVLVYTITNVGSYGAGKVIGNLLNVVTPYNLKGINKVVFKIGTFTIVMVLQSLVKKEVEKQLLSFSESLKELAITVTDKDKSK